MTDGVVEMKDRSPTDSTMPLSGSPKVTDSSHDLTSINPNRDEAEDEPTDSGWRAWLAVVSGVINFMAGFGILNSWGSFQAKYAHEPWAKEVSLAEIGWIGSVQPGLLFFLGGFIGWTSDKVGCRLLMRIGTILFLSAHLLVAEYGKSFGDFLALQGFMYGLSNTLLYYPIVNVISHWFHRRRGLALGIASAGSSVGGIFWPFVIDRLHESLGMKRALQSVGLIPLVPLIIASFIVNERKSTPKIRLRDILRRNFSKLKDSEKTHSGSNLKGLRTVVQPRFIALSIACFFVYGGFLIPFNYIPLFAEVNGHSELAHSLLAMCYAGSVVGRVGSRALADRFGSFNVLSTISFLTAILTLCWILMESLPAMIAFSVLYGLFSGGLVPLGSACVAKITPEKEMKNLGFRLGFMMMICSFSAFGGGPMSNFLLESQGQGNKGWLAAFLFSGLLTLVGGCLLLSSIIAGCVAREPTSDFLF